MYCENLRFYHRNFSTSTSDLPQLVYSYLVAKEGFKYDYALRVRIHSIVSWDDLVQIQQLLAGRL